MDQMNTDQLLQQLSGDTESAISQLESRAEAEQDFAQRFSEIEQQMDEAAKIRDTSQRDIRMKVLAADLEELRKDAATEEEDLAQAVFGLNAMLEGMGEEYANLNKPDSKEEAAIKAAEQKLEQAKDRLDGAKNRRFFKQRAITDARADLQEAEQSLKTLTQKVQRDARQRLLQADMESSLQQFMLRVEKTLQIMEARKNGH